MRKWIAVPLMMTLFALTYFQVFVQPASAYVSLTAASQLVPSAIEPGESGSVLLTITNGGTSYARRVKLTVKSHSYISFGQRIYELQTIAPSSSKQVSVPITISSSIPEYTTTIFFDIEYAEGDTTGTNKFETSTSISISKRSLVQIEGVEWSDELIEPGDVVTADVFLKNVGQSSMRDVTVTFGNSTLPFVPSAGDMEIYLGTLGVGETKEANFSIILNNDARTIAYRVPVTITYYDDSGALHTDAKYIGMRVSGEPEFVVTLEEDSKAFSGGKGEITISLANRGTATAGYLTLSFDSDLDITPSEYYVGNLDPDDYETVTLEIDLSEIPSGRRPLDIEMSYKDPYNQEAGDSASLMFMVHAIPPLTIPPTTMVIVVVALAVIVYWKRKFFFGLFRRKK